jgi:molecular chaperone DnaK
LISITVTATEKGKGNQGSLVVNNAAVKRLSSQELIAAQEELAALFAGGMGMFDDAIEFDETIEVTSRAVETRISPELIALQSRAQELLSDLDDREESDELEGLMEQLSQAIESGNNNAVNQAREELEDFLYYAASNTEVDPSSDS